MKITKINNHNPTNIAFIIEIPYMELIKIKAKYTGKEALPNTIPDFLLELGIVAEEIDKTGGEINE